MAVIRATRTPDGGPPSRGGPVPSVRYAANPTWPGITGPFDARCWGCTWAMHNGVYQVKYVSAMCAVHSRAS